MIFSISMQNFALDTFNILHNLFILIHNSWNIIIIQLNNHLILDIVLVLILSIILFAGRAGKILDTTHKFVTTIAAGTIANQNWPGDSSNDNNNDSDKNKDDKDKKDKKEDNSDDQKSDNKSDGKK
jgi:hypothetical protein